MLIGAIGSKFTPVELSEEFTILGMSLKTPRGFTGRITAQIIHVLKTTCFPEFTILILKEETNR